MKQYVYKIIKGNIHYCDSPISLNKGKIKRYSQRLDIMGVNVRPKFLEPKRNLKREEELKEWFLSRCSKRRKSNGNH